MLLSAAVTGTLTLAAFAQFDQSESGPATRIILRNGNRPPDAREQMIMREKIVQRRNFNAANTERLRQMTQAAEMLETLAISLKVQVDKDESGKASEDELRKAENIAKLARIVQERMKITVAPN